jgi:hypothetical protein
MSVLVICTDMPGRIGAKEEDMHYQTDLYGRGDTPLSPRKFV